MGRVDKQVLDFEFKCDGVLMESKDYRPMSLKKKTEKRAWEMLIYRKVG